MPATEQTWRDQKRMHVIFGIASVLMLVTTIWMLAVDHDREWKKYQRKFRDVESGTISARIRQQENQQFEQELAKRRAALGEAEREVPPKEEIDEFKQLLTSEAEQRGVAPPSVKSIDAAYEALVKAHEDYVSAVQAGGDGAGVEKAAKKVVARRGDLLLELEQHVANAKFRESNFLREKKFGAAFFDVDRSEYEIGVGNNLPEKKLEEVESKVLETKEVVDKKNLQVEQAKSQRLQLERVLGQVVARQAQSRKALDEQLGKLDQLEKAYEDRSDNWAKNLFAMPIIDAFGRPLKVDQIWLPKLTINNNFRDVARFDRCTTCHQGLDKTAPGSAVAPAYASLSEVNLTLATPDADPTDEAAAPAAEGEAKSEAKADAKAEAPAEAKPDKRPRAVVQDELLGKYFGLHLAEHGLLSDHDVTLSVVRPESLGAKAGLNVGDVLREINGVPVLGKNIAYRYLVDNVDWGHPIRLKVQRGLPNPYTSHPKLDLFVGSLSPHKMADIGCTICHEGQGSATDFKWASHMPSSPGQGDRWKNDHGWFNNHHWIFPMNPKRHAESSCLKCHHEVVELEPSEKFPEPPAPKLVAGYELIRQYGCYGCHEINGYDGPNRRIGPDMRTEPNYTATAQALLFTGELDPAEKALARQLINAPENDVARHSLQESLRIAASPAAKAEEASADADEVQNSKPAAQPRVSPATRKLVNVLDDVESPGKLRKVGPSLRHVASKVDYEFLYSWVRKPKDFRPTTKMPQFFSLHDHLDGVGLDTSKAFEPIEIRGIAEYLLTNSQPFEYADAPRGMEKASAERGKELFETRGCLACHQHADFPKGQMKQGPNLTNLGGKLDRKSNPDGKRWLYSWLRNPNAYHPRTLMPNLILDPIKDEKGKSTDPAADLSAYLLSSNNWKPQNVPPRAELTEDETKALHNLSLENLRAAFPSRQANEYYDKGIPESLRYEIKGDEIELLGDASTEKHLQYIGRRAITKYGCSGCHDVPGYEDVKPIGTGLADWGRKSADKLAFEQITQYILKGHGHDKPPAANNVNEDDAAYEGPHDFEEGEKADAGLIHREGSHELDFAAMDPSIGYFMEKLFGHEREGFIWQKLRAPRTYDYKKTENKGYNERLRMPQFNLNEDEREHVITFVLGLLAEPPAQQYVYKPAARRAAIIEGSKVIEKYNCKGCHAFQMDRWDLAYAPDDFRDPPNFDDYGFLDPRFSPQAIKASLEIDPRGLRHASVRGMPVVNEKTGKLEKYDEEGSPLEPDDTSSRAFAKFIPFDSLLINGKVRPAGLQTLPVPLDTVAKKFPTAEELHENPAGYGGYLPKLIYPSVLAIERKSNPAAKGDEAWGWLPPPLVGEGRKVQTSWLHNFLLDPYPIRPAVVLRMPKFNMSSAEASALVNYFAAVDNAEYPYDFDPRTREGYLSGMEEKEDHPHRLADALKIVTDNNYCVKCHYLGDFDPPGSNRAKGPHLDEVYKRLRPNYTLAWIANPKRLLPYTGMPVNFPPNKPASESLYHGTSLEQLNAVVDLLMNYDRFIESRTSMKPLIKAPAPGAGAAGAGAAGAGAQVPREESLR